MRYMHGNRFRRGIKVIAIVALVLIVLGAVVAQLWNALMPAIFGLHTISFGQALGLLVLCKILFGGWRGGRAGHWARHYRYDHLTPEERQRMREKFASRGWFNRCDAEPMQEQDKK